MGSGCSARLVELSLPTPEVHSSNPVTANFCKEYLIYLEEILCIVISLHYCNLDEDAHFYPDWSDTEWVLL